MQTWSVSCAPILIWKKRSGARTVCHRKKPGMPLGVPLETQL
jgi:hypothetical protein